MNEQEMIKLVDKIIRHYQRLGGFNRRIPHDIDDCTDPLVCKVLEADNYELPPGSQTGFYHHSITTVSEVKSSTTGELLELQPLPIPGLYWIRRSQGYDNAPILAHIHSWGGKGQELFAFVAK